MGRKVLAALMAVLVLSGGAWAAEIEEMGETPGTEPQGTESGEEILTGYDWADLFQEGSFTGPQTMPDEAELFADPFTEMVYAGLKNKQSEISVSGCGVNTSDLAARYSKVINDSPEFFYVLSGFGYTYNNRNEVLTVKPSYYDGSLIKYSNGSTKQSKNLLTDEVQRDFDQAVSRALAQVNDSMTPLEKALVLHDYLVINCKYNWDVAVTETNNDATVHSAYGALVQGDPVCQGYALAYQLLLKKAGIEAAAVTSEAMNHMWNMIRLDGTWYHVDVTWDDPTPDFAGKCLHKYFLLSDNTIETMDIRPAVVNGKPVENYNWGHHDWEKIYSCSSKKYESGYRFNESDWPFYNIDGRNFYYIQGSDQDDSTYRIMYGALDSPGTERKEFKPYLNHTWSGNQYSCSPKRFAVLWLDGCMYYMDYDLNKRESQLCCVSLKTGKEAALGKLTDETLAAYGSKYETGHDGFGLKYEDEVIKGLSPTRPGLIRGTFAPYEFPAYPEDWDTRPDGILGVTAGNKVGIRLENVNSATLYAAAYVNGKLSNVQIMKAALEEGVNLVELKTPLPVSGDWKLFLTDSSHKPLCAALPKPAA